MNQRLVVHRLEMEEEPGDEDRRQPITARKTARLVKEALDDANRPTMHDVRFKEHRDET